MNAHSTDLKTLLRDPSLLETRAFVAGEWIDADDGATFEVTNPARGDVIARMADLGRPEVARAIDAAAAAMKDWAIEKGASHYAHVFYPLTGFTAEKHDSFLEPDDAGVLGVGVVLAGGVVGQGVGVGLLGGGAGGGHGGGQA